MNNDRPVMSATKLLSTKCTFQRCIDSVDSARLSSARQRQTMVGWEKQAILELIESMSLVRWRWRLLHYFKQIVNLSATCFTSNWSNFWHAFASRVSVSWASLLSIMLDLRQTNANASKSIILGSRPIGFHPEHTIPSLWRLRWRRRPVTAAARGATV